MTHRRHLISIDMLAALLLLLASCNRSATPAAQPPSSTVNPTPPPSLTPVWQPVLDGTAVPRSARPISAATAKQVVELAQRGKGALNHLALSPDGRTLAIATGVGVYLNKTTD